MNTPRSTLLAERILVWMCIIVGVWFFGYEYGTYRAKSEAVPCPSQKMHMTPIHQKRFIKYYGGRG